MPLTVGSLFSGIGGLELGLEWAGLQTKWQVEYDSYCQKVLAERWPNVKRYGDIYEVKGSELEYVDVICGGFPCQPFSHAGKRKGTADSRWLWPEFIRIVREVKPRWVVVENVPGLLTIDSGRVFAGILRDLAESGYDAEWQSVRASDVGARHRRERLFIVAKSGSNGCRGRDNGNARGGNGALQTSGPRSTAESTILADTNNPQAARQREHGGEVIRKSESIRPRESGNVLADPKSAECQSTNNSRRRGIGLTNGSIFNPAILAYLRARNTGPGGIWEYDPADVPDTQRLRLECTGKQRSLRQEGEIPVGERCKPSLTAEICDSTPGTGTNRREEMAANGPTLAGMGELAHGLPAAMDYGFTPRVGTKISERVNRLKCLGNAVVPQVAEFIGLCIMQAEAE